MARLSCKAIASAHYSGRRNKNDEFIFNINYSDPCGDNNYNREIWPWT